MSRLHVLSAFCHEFGYRPLTKSMICDGFQRQKRLARVVPEEWLDEDMLSSIWPSLSEGRLVVDADDRDFLAVLLEKVSGDILLIDFVHFLREFWVSQIVSEQIIAKFFDMSVEIVDSIVIDSLEVGWTIALHLVVCQTSYQSIGIPQLSSD
jgi:hypothetical protein